MRVVIRYGVLLSSRYCHKHRIASNLLAQLHTVKQAKPQNLFLPTYRNASTESESPMKQPERKRVSEETDPEKK